MNSTSESEHQTPRKLPKFLHDIKENRIEIDGTRSTFEEYVIDGDKGLMIKYYSRSGDKPKEKVLIFQIPGNKYKMIITVGDDKEESEIGSKAELLKELKKNKNLQFAVKYVESQKGGARRRAGTRKNTGRRGSRRSRGTKATRMSRKTSRRNTRGSRKSRRRNSRQNSRRRNY